MMIKGKTTYGCSNWKSGCTFRLPFEFMGKEVDERILEVLLQKGETPVLMGFTKEMKKINGKLKLDTNFNLLLLQ
jgi:DNA topoisomerase-3